MLASWSAEYGTGAPPPGEEAQPDQETLDTLAFDDDDDDAPSLQGICPEGFIEIKGQCISVEKLMQALAESQFNDDNLLTEDETTGRNYPDCDADPTDVGCPEWEGWAVEEEHQQAYDRAEEMPPMPPSNPELEAEQGGWGEEVTDPEIIAQLEAEEALGLHDPYLTPGARREREEEIQRSAYESMVARGYIGPEPSRTPHVSQEDLTSISGLVAQHQGLEAGARAWREENPGRQMPTIDLCTSPDGTITPACQSEMSPTGRSWPWMRSGRPYHPFAASSDESDRMMRDLGVDMDLYASPFRPPERTDTRRRRRRPDVVRLGGSDMPGIEGNCPPGHAMILGRCINIATLLSNLSE
jgi:hypothetical protein